MAMKVLATMLVLTHIFQVVAQDCGTPNETGYAFTDAGTTYGDTSNVTCDTGYTGTAAPTTVECLQNGTWSTVSGCAIVECGTPIETGYVFTGTGKTYGDMYNLTRATGYTGSVTPSVVDCLETRNWTTVSGCIIVDCGTPNETGYAFTDAGTTYGDTSNVTCDTGYTGTAAPTTVECLQNGTWSTVSGCAIVECGTPIETGYVFTGTGKTYGDMYNLTRATGYTGSVTPSVVDCLETRNWTTVSGCIIVDCGTPNEIGYAFTDAGTTYGDTSNVTCDTGYTGTAAPTTVECLQNGTWLTVSGCAIVECGTPIETGYVFTGTGKTYGDMYNLTRATGYTGSVTPSVVDCLETRNWTTLSGCIIVDCKKPKLPAHGDVTLSNDNTKYGAVAVQTCHLGYDIFGTTNFECLASGHWSAGVAICTPKDCGRLYAPINGKINGLTSTASSSYGAIANFTCKSGYKLDGMGQRVCKSNGNWSGNSDPFCLMQETATCGDAVVVPYSDYAYNDAATEAMYTCHGGYEFENANHSELQCPESGRQWNGTAPICKLKGNHKKLSVTMVFATEPDIDLSDEKVRLDYRVKIEDLVQERIRIKINNSDIYNGIYVKVSSLRRGSLIADFDFVVADTTDVMSKFLEATVYLLQLNDTIDIDGISGNFLRIELGNDIYTSDNAGAFQCAAFITIRGSCAIGYECVVTNGVAECRAEKPKDNFGVIIGVGIGVPIGLITVVLVAVLILYIKRKSEHQKRYTHRGSSEVEYELRSPSKFVTRYTTDYGKTYGYFGPQQAENNYGSQHLPQSRPGSWEQSSDSKSSWDFMYHGNLYPPGTKFEIKRPQIRA